MSSKRPVPLLLLLALPALWCGASAFRSQKEASLEYRIEVDINQKRLDTMVSEGWEFTGYLGQSVTGSNADETLWKRPLQH